MGIPKDKYGNDKSMNPFKKTKKKRFPRWKAYCRFLRYKNFIDFEKIFNNSSLFKPKNQ